MIKVGDLVRFEGGLVPMRLYGKIAVYLGEDFIHRDDGVIVENHKLLLQGQTAPYIIDRNCLKWLKELPVNEYEMNK